MAVVAHSDDEDNGDVTEQHNLSGELELAGEPESSPQLELGSAYGTPLGPERQRELQGYLDKWHDQSDHGWRKGPFHGVTLREADLSWLAARVRTASGNVPDLHLMGADLGGVQLAGV